MCALFTALTAVLSQAAVPIGPVPVNLATFSVFCAGALLGAKLGGISQLVYVLLGAAGAPVFSMFRGGLNILAGPTGGYLAGYVLAAFVVGLIVDRNAGKLYVCVLAMAAGFAAYMVPGTLWFMFSTNTGLKESLMVCVVPFLPGDALKIGLAAAVSVRLRPLLRGVLSTGD